MQEKRSLSEAEWAWLAGLFEGEGTFNFHSKRSVAAKIAMTDRDVLETVNRLFPSVGGLKTVVREPHKAIYLWLLCSRDDVIDFITGILPWLHSRRRQRAEEALARLATNRGWHSGKSHCRNGHLWAEAGIYTSPNGKRHCRECMKESAERYKLKHRKRYLANHRRHEQDRRRRMARAKKEGLGWTS